MTHAARTRLKEWTQISSVLDRGRFSQDDVHEATRRVVSNHSITWRQPEAAQNLWELRGSPDRGKQVRWARVNLMR
jgi:hypothetical protein